MKNLLKKMVVLALPVAALSLGGCASNDPQLVTFDTITPRPDVDSVGDETLFVAQMTGPGGFTFDMPRGYRYYLVDLEADRVLTSDVTTEAGKIEVGKDGATFEGEQIWEGDTQGAQQIGLFISERPEQVEGRE